jgi:phosphoserine aminotransferase
VTGAWLPEFQRKSVRRIAKIPPSPVGLPSLARVAPFASRERSCYPRKGRPVRFFQINSGELVRVFNFAAGPATLPLEVLQQAREELTDWQGCGMSVMEVSHRSKAFIAVAEEAEALLRELLAVPANYKVLFLQGGGMGQFSAVPMNLAAPDSVVDYINTGAWSKKALGEAKRYAKVNVAADEAASSYTTVPEQGALQLTPNAAYVHYTPNETIGGVEFPYIPHTGSVPLVADMSSSILSRPMDVSKYGVIYASAQKNIGPAGLAVVIVREDLLGRARPTTPSILHYQAMAAEGSMSNTPPTFAWYLAGLVFKWLKSNGGLTWIAERNRGKAAKLYDAIDSSGFYRNPVAKPCRSLMNVPFTLAKPELDKTFLTQARAAGLANLEGHRSVGGMRASIYNAMSPEGIDALIGFMKEFQRRHG